MTPEQPEVAKPSAQPSCEAPIPVYEGGRITRSVCEPDAASEGLTVVDLSDQYAPSVFDEAPELGKKGRQPYRPTLIALENEAFGEGPEFDRAKQDRFLELYGIFPSFGVLAKRLSDEARHACHAGVDNGPLERLSRTLNPWRDKERLQGELGHTHKLVRQLEWERHRRSLGAVDDLRSDPTLELAFRDYDRSRASGEAIAAVQSHLRCDGLLGPKFVPGALDYATSDALARFQRRSMIVSWELDDETRLAVLTSSRELDFRSLLRALRERVVDATGLLEDGSASGEQESVVGRQLDSAAFRPSPKDGALENAAPDLVARATDAAARALGWSGPEAARSFFDGLGPGATATLRVAIKLPPPPAYHTKAMDLRVVIDRGDVYYDYPFTPSGADKLPPVERRPRLMVYAKDGDREIALVRWPTTIGGWKPEKIAPRLLQMVYKESPAGPRIWRDLIVTPVWVPPESAPKRELIRPRSDGSFVLNRDLFGPGYASAFGLVKLVHHRVAHLSTPVPNPPVYDEGIGTHGSVSYDSIHHGTSHGCHRLQNHMAVRLGEFLLKHRTHKTKGTIEIGYGRSFAWQGKPLTLSFDAGGFKYELDPPVPVEVLRGRVMTSVTSPPRPAPLPEPLAKRMIQERFED